MSENEIKLIRQLINNLEAKKFDLEAWKSPAIVYLSRIFGSSSEHVRQIRELKYDYSSWSLRDTSGGVQLTDPVRTRAKEILEAAITELEIFGAPKQISAPSGMLEAFHDEFTGKEMEELENLLALPEKERAESLRAFLTGKEKALLISILVKYLLQSSQR